MLTCFCSGCCAAAPSIARAANGRSAASSASSRLRFGPLPAQGLRSVMDRTELATDELAEHTLDRDYVQQCSAPSETTWGTPGVELRGEAAAVTLQRRRWSSWPTQALSPGTAVQNSGLRSHTCRMCPDTLRLIEGIPLMHSGRGASRLAPATSAQMLCDCLEQVSRMRSEAGFLELAQLLDARSEAQTLRLRRMRRLSDEALPMRSKRGEGTFMSRSATSASMAASQYLVVVQAPSAPQTAPT